MSAEDPPTPSKDVVLVGGPVEQGNGVRILRFRDERIEVGEMRPAKEGQPIHGELVRLEQREEHPQLFDAETLVPAPRASHAGPAQVATTRYRQNWETIFGTRARQAGGNAPN